MGRTVRVKMDDKNYLALYPGGYGLTTNKANAFLFTSTKAAENTLMNQMPQILKKYIRTAKIEDILDTATATAAKPNNNSVNIKQEMQAIEPEISQSLQEVNVTEIKDLVNEIENIFVKIRSNKDKLNSSLSLVDQEICDILHYIEFNKFSACEGYKLAKMLKECRTRRREIKDQLEIVKIASTHSADALFKGTTSQALDNLDHRQYKPRILTELFDKKTMSFNKN